MNKSVFLIQLSSVGSSFLETWLLETKCAKMTFGNGVIQIFSCKFYSMCGGHHCNNEILNHTVYSSCFKVHVPVKKMLPT